MSTISRDAPPAVADLTGSDDEYPRSVEDLHVRAIRWFEEAERATQEEREAAEQARDYKSGEQWTQDEVNKLNSRGQPPVVINHISRKVELLCGLERKSRTDPKAFPRTPTEEQRADAATQALRFVADDCDFSIIRSAVYENMLVEGTGGCLVDLEDDGQGGANIVPRWVGWDRLWRDPHSRMPDFSDARYRGLVLWMDRDQLREMYPDVEDVTDNSFGQMSGSTYDDRPNGIAWQDSTRQRCRVVNVHWLEAGDWWEMTYTRAGVLVQPAKSPLKDRKGKTACRLIMQSAYVDRHNRRYGIVRDLISPQDEINKRRSKALHLLSTRLVITETGAVEDEDKARREVAKPDGFVVVNPGMRFEIAQTADLAVGQMKLLEHATIEMQAAGPNASMMGIDNKELSGRAILAQQAGGAAQNEPVADSLRHWSRRVYEMIWMAARQYWTAGKWLRVTDDLGSTRWVGINRPITLKDELAEMDEQRRAMIMQQMQLVPGDPRLDQVLRIENDITDLDVDITIEEGQDVPALQAETFQTLVQLAGMQPGIIPANVLIAASGLRNKEDLLKMLKEHQQAQAAKQQEVDRVAKANAEAEVQGKQAKAAADLALAKERQHNSMHMVHQMAADFTSDPYGQPHVADNAEQPAAPLEQGVNPMLQDAQALATVRNTEAKTVTEAAKARDLHFASVLKAAQTHATMHPPPAAKGKK